MTKILTLWFLICLSINIFLNVHFFKCFNKLKHIQKQPNLLYKKHTPLISDEFRCCSLAGNAVVSQVWCAAINHVPNIYNDSVQATRCQRVYRDNWRPSSSLPATSTWRCCRRPLAERQRAVFGSTIRGKQFWTKSVVNICGNYSSTRVIWVGAQMGVRLISSNLSVRHVFGKGLYT